MAHFSVKMPVVLQYEGVAPVLFEIRVSNAVVFYSIKQRNHFSICRRQHGKAVAIKIRGFFTGQPEAAPVFIANNKIESMLPILTMRQFSAMRLRDGPVSKK